jgi:hypothetical protein
MTHRSDRGVARHPSPATVHTIDGVHLPNLPACAKRAVGPRACAPTTVCPWPPTPGAGSPHSPPGGSAWASCPRSASPANPRRTATMNACSARCRRTPLTPPPALGLLHSASVSASARRATSSGRTRRSTGAHPPPALYPPPGSGPTHGYRSSPLTASRGATSAPMRAAGGTIKGATSHASASASAPMSASMTLPRASSMCTSDPTHLVGCSDVLGASKMLMGDWQRRR